MGTKNTGDDKKDPQRPPAEKGEQMDLINVSPTHSKELLKLAKQYKKHEDDRLNAIDKKRELRGKILDCIHEEKLQPIDGGVIKFHLEGIEFCITPSEDSLKIKFPVDEE